MSPPLPASAATAATERAVDESLRKGFAANLSTALLVTTASFNGLPVSTTHLSVGSLLDMGIVTGQAKWKPLRGVLASWFITLPCAALLAALGYGSFSYFSERTLKPLLAQVWRRCAPLLA